MLMLFCMPHGVELVQAAAAGDGCTMVATMAPRVMHG
jgi:hypothetical protein